MSGKLSVIVPMRVVHKRSGARRSHSNGESLSGFHGRRLFIVKTSPFRNPVVVAFELDSVPVNAGRLLQFIDDIDFHRLSLGQHNNRTG